MNGPRPGTTGTVVLSVLFGVAALWTLLAAFLVVSSAVGGASRDPHGYGVIFGFLMLMLGLPFLLGFGIPFVRRLRRRG